MIHVLKIMVSAQAGYVYTGSHSLALSLSALPKVVHSSQQIATNHIVKVLTAIVMGMPWYFWKRYKSGAAVSYLERGQPLVFSFFMRTCTVEACKTVLSSQFGFS